MSKIVDKHRPTLHVDRMSMHLPPGFGDRAPLIVRRVGELLAAAQLPAGLTREHLRVGPLRVDTHHSDEQVARTMSAAIVAGLTHDHDAPLEGQPQQPATAPHGGRHA